jgi:hypothetical protein
VLLASDSDAVPVGDEATTGETWEADAAADVDNGFAEACPVDLVEETTELDAFPMEAVVESLAELMLPEID